MQRFLVEAILNKIQTDLTQFKTVALFNDDFNKQDEGVIDSFRMPALFISFPDGADYTGQGGKVQKADDLLVRFYIADQLTKDRLSISKTVLDIFDLKQTVFNEFQGWQVTATNETFGAFQRIHEETDENRSNYYIFVQDYKTTLVDSSKWIRQGTEVTLTLDLTSDLVINPNTKATVDGIRTAKDVNDD